MKLTDIEQQFLAEKQKTQKELHEKVCAIRKTLTPLEEEYDSLQGKADVILDEMKIIARKQQQITEESDLFRLKMDLSDVSRDVNKLLKKLNK